MMTTSVVSDSDWPFNTVKERYGNSEFIYSRVELIIDFVELWIILRVYYYKVKQMFV